MDIEEIKYFFFDLDKTVWNWNEPIIEADNVIRNLKDRNKFVKFYTDNTLLSRAEYAKKLTRMDIPAEKEDIITSGYTTAQYLAENNINDVYVIGEQGIIEELEKEDVNITKDAKTVVNGFDRKFNYQKLKEAKTILEKPNSQLLNCSKEKIFRTTKAKNPHQLPINKALSTYARKTKNTGKPSEIYRKTFRNYFSYFPEKSLLIGDNLNDIRLGNQLGMKTGVVMSGDTDREQLKNVEGHQEPDIGLTSLQRLKRRLL